MVVYNAMAEASVLGTILANSECLERFSLAPEYFGHHLNRAIFGTVLAIKENRGELTLANLNDKLINNSDYLKAGGLDYLNRLLATKNEEDYLSNISLLREKLFIREVNQVNKQIDGVILDNPVDLNLEISRRVAELQKLEDAYLAKDGSNVITGLAATDALIRRIELNSLNTNHYTGIPTGYRNLDRLCLGLQLGDFNLIAARPSAGKTAAATSITENNIRINPDDPILVFTLEMKSEQYMGRVISGLSRISSQRIRLGALSQEEWFRLAWARQQIKNANLYIDDTSGINVRYMEESILALEKKIGKKPKLVISDYIQIMTPNEKQKSRELEVGSISRDLKSLAKRRNIAVLALAQLNREGEKVENSRPKLSQMRESDALAMEADLVLLIHRDKQRKADSVWGDIAEFIIAKQRNGPIDTVYTAYVAEYTRFEDLIID